MFFCCGSSASCYRSNSNTKSSVTTWLQKRRPCSRHHSLRSVGRASVLDQFWLSERMCKIYMKTNGFRGACPPNHCVCNVSRAWSFPSAGHPRGSLHHSLGHLGSPWPPKGFSSMIIHSSIHASIHPYFFLTSHRASGVGGSAVRMKCPDDKGRRAGIGRTQDWKKLELFWACP